MAVAVAERRRSLTSKVPAPFVPSRRRRWQRLARTFHSLTGVTDSPHAICQVALPGSQPISTRRRRGAAARCQSQCMRPAGPTRGIQLQSLQFQPAWYSVSGSYGTRCGLWSGVVGDWKMRQAGRRAGIKQPSRSGCRASPMCKTGKGSRSHWQAGR